VQITALTPQRRATRFDLFVDGEFRLALALEVVERLGLCAGHAIDAARLAAAEAADLRWRARDAALSLLAYRARTTAELRRGLLRRAFPPEVVDALLAELRDRGYLDDDAFARAFVRDRTGHRPRGASRLVQELRALGVASDAAGRAVHDVFHEQGLSETRLALAAAEDWLRQGGAGKTGPEARRRLRAYLARRGFQGDAARAALDALLR
jgi:regulatory protein